MSDVLRHEPAGRSSRIRDGAPLAPPVPVPPSTAASAASEGPPPSDGGGDQPHLTDYLRVLYKRRWPALTLLVLVVTATAIYSFTATPLYSARVQILIEKEATNVVSFKETIEQNQVTDDYYQTQYRILQSRALARRTLDALNLWQHPQFSGASGGEGVGAAIASFVTRRTAASAPAEPPAAGETRTQSAAIDRFLSQLTVSPIRNSRLVDVSVESTDPKLAADIANALAKAYIEQNLEFKFLASKEASDWLTARLSEQRAKVEKSEQALQRYREQNGAIAIDDRQNIVVQKLADLNGAVTRAKTERIAKEAMYHQLQSLQNDPARVDTFPAILGNSFIQQQKSELADLQRQQAQLSDKFGDKHPDMIRIKSAIQVSQNKLTGEIAKVVQSVRSEYQAAVAQEQNLLAALDQQKAEALAMNRKGIEYGVLARDAASNRQIFESLMQRTKETGISGELKTSNIRVVDAAEPPRRPIAPRTRNNLIVALLAGSMMGIGIAFFFDYLDNRIKNPDEMSRQLGLPFLGMIPSAFVEGPVLISDPRVPPTFAEGFRSLRTNVVFSSAEDGLRSVVITSTGPSEGKTVVATNLAASLAQTGARVLLIDADMRRARVHSVFDKRLHPGLSDFLVGRTKVSETVHATQIPGLWMMSAGTTPPNPSELLSSKRFADLIASLGHHFDWAIIDTPPIMPVTDAAIVGSLVTGVVFVVGSEMTNRHAAQRAVDQLRRGHARFLGAVLNRVDLKHHGYYYSHYYRREYAQYYGSAAGM